MRWSALRELPIERTRSMAVDPSGGPGPPDPTLAHTLASLQGALQTGRPPREFSPEALGVLLERQSEYVEELGLEAIRVARRARADVVSAVDVQQADQLVRSAERVKHRRALETLGGLLAGAGLGLLGTQLADGDKATAIGWILGGVLTGVGLVLLTWALAARP